MSELLLRRRNLLLRKQEELNIRAVCFKADGEQTVELVKHNYTSSKVFQYSYDGVTWESWDMSPLPFGGQTKVYVRGYNKTLGWDLNTYTNFVFGTDAFVYVSGVVESLLDGDNEVLTYGTQGILRQLFYHQTALRSAENLRFEAQSTSANIISVYALMFDGCTNLLYAPKVLPANDFKGSYNYQYMFRDCKSLITAPELPATVLGSQCYQYMFYGCTSLVNAPELPATTLAAQCYQYMFYGCTSLVNAPELPATNLSESCYQHMFYGCTSLVNAPKLPATTLAPNCYRYMFYGCTSLNILKCHAKVSASDATYNWLNGVKTSGTFYGKSEYGWSSGASGIPTTWTFEELTD